jgi:hypothetical protein
VHKLGNRHVVRSIARPALFIGSKLDLCSPVDAQRFANRLWKNYAPYFIDDNLCFNLPKTHLLAKQLATRSRQAIVAGIQPSLSTNYENPGRCPGLQNLAPSALSEG